LNLKFNRDEVAITFVNHATVLVQTEKFNFLTDPVWSERVSPIRWIGPIRHREPGIPFEQLPKIDFVLVSHNHYDHMDVATLQRLNETFHPRFFVPLGNKRFLDGRGIENVTELDWWQSDKQTQNLKVSLAPAEHFSGRGLFDRNKIDLEAAIKKKKLLKSRFITLPEGRTNRFKIKRTAHLDCFEVIIFFLTNPDIYYSAMANKHWALHCLGRLLPN